MYCALVKVISKCSELGHYMIAMCMVGMCLVLNASNPIPFYGLKFLLGGILYVLLAGAIGCLHDENNRLVQSLSDDRSPVDCLTKYVKSGNSNLNLISCVAVCAFFVTTFLGLGLVELNPIGVCCLFLLSVLIFMEFMVYQSYVSALYLLHDLPYKTCMIVQYCRHCRNVLSILGLLFVVLFESFMPFDSISVFSREFWSVPMIYAWVFIGVAVIFVLLTSIYLQIISKQFSN